MTKQIIEERIEDFRKTSFKWVDLENEEGLYIQARQVENFLRQALLSYRQQIAEELVEALEGMKKEQLGKNDPDNYGACYAIGGFNDALSKAQEIIRERLNS